MIKKASFRFIAGLFVAILIVTACSLPGVTISFSPPAASTTQAYIDAVGTSVAATQTAQAGSAPVNPPTTPETAVEPTATIVHNTMPGEPPGNRESGMTDPDSSGTAAERRANGGENFDQNLYERPFNANSMDTYFPDLDIKRASLSRSGGWVYVTIDLVGVRPGGGLEGNYGIEMDLDVDGRGDWLILASTPGSAWSTAGVRVWRDANRDVGNDFPISSDPPQRGDGYETLAFDQGHNSDPDVAWARVSPQNPNSVQIAFKYSLIANDNYFMWGAWTDQGVFNPAWYDYNDHFTAAEAGSPLPGLKKYYPLKALAEVDNTCRWSVGFTPAGDEPGVCPVYKPPTATPPPPPTAVPTNTPYQLY